MRSTGVFGLLDLLALAAVVIAALGIVNTLSMDTLERVREIGMLRAAGMSRRQVWRSVLVEAGILGAIGGARRVGRRRADRACCWSAARRAADLASRGARGPTIALSIVLGVALAMLAAAQPARIAGRVPDRDRGPGRIGSAGPAPTRQAVGARHFG